MERESLIPIFAVNTLKCNKAVAAGAHGRVRAAGGGAVPVPAGAIIRRRTVDDGRRSFVFGQPSSV
jgi:hypothetical protein